MRKSNSVWGVSFWAVWAITIFMAGCGQGEPDQPPQTSAAESPAAAPAMPVRETVSEESCDNAAANGMPLFGDLHVHTSFSFDAAANSTGATPAHAQRFARGRSIPFFPLDEQGKPIGSVQIDRPLDFLAVTDHGEFLGERALCRTPGSPVYDNEFCINYRADERQGMMMLAASITTETPERISEVCGADGKLCPEFAKAPWQEIQNAANEANQPCQFTSFVAYEYTGTPGTSNYHRNVIFRNANVPASPVSYIDAPIDSKLWAALDVACDLSEGCDYLTIPHNTNLANGRMAPYMQLEDTDEAKRGYARTRLHREPIMEIFQHKGGSECINGLSSILGAPDELCSTEAVRHIGETKSYVTRNQQGSQLTLGRAEEVTRECAVNETGSNGMLGAGCVHPTDFQRSALAIGLAEEQRIGLNPIKLGIIASTDTHTATPGAVREDSWGGAVSGEATPAERLQPGLLTSGIDGNPGGLAGVWAKQNTRNAIFDAMLRREVFGTSGPRIVPRFFAGWDFDPNLCSATDRDEIGYATGVPMGGDLAAAETSAPPSFLAYAAKDPQSEDLVALQLIKGWVGEDGTLNTTVLPMAQSADGAATLCAVYSDPGFDPKLPAYYYLRVVERESPRWHTYDCERIDEQDRPAVCSEYPATISEMAWTSPIWYRSE